LAFAGVIVIVYRPGTFSMEIGLVFVAASAFIGAAGTIIMKRIEPMQALSLQAWVGVLSFLPLFILSAFIEKNQISSFVEGGPGIWGAMAFSVLAVSVFGHSAYYQLLKGYDVTLLAPLTLLTPIVAVLIGIVVLKEPLSVNLLIGGGLTLAGVFLVAIRENKSLPPDAVVRAEIG
jgi:O-acetylserine/cysteine efflux transporter